MENIYSLLMKPEFYLPFLIWSIVWKGLALWKSAGKRQLIWFVLILVVNTLSVLEIAYVFYFNKFDLDNGKILGFLEKKFKRK